MASGLRLGGVAVLLSCTVGASAAQDRVPDQQHSAFEVQRQLLMEESAAKEQACLGRFFVTDCQNQVAAQRRKGLAEINRQEQALNAAQRLQRVAEQEQRIADQQTQRALRDADVPDPEQSPAMRQQRQAEKQASHVQQAQSQRRVAAQPKVVPNIDAAQRQRTQQAYDDKMKALEKRRADRDQRVRDHPNSGPPLPIETK